MKSWKNNSGFNLGGCDHEAFGTVNSSWRLVDDCRYFAEDYKTVCCGSEAYLDVAVVSAGCYEDVNIGQSTTRPWLTVAVRLVRPDDEKVLYRRGFSYGDSLHAGCKEVPEDPKYRFRSFEYLVENPELYTDRMRRAVTIVAAEIAQDLAD